MRSGASRLLPVTGAIAAGATALAFAAYRKEMRAAGRRIAAHRQVIASAQGPIEFAESGNGRAVLLIHGAGGGFDQGLDLGQVFLGDGFRVIAPSRFGYLGTPLPADASAEAQADAHLRLLDALQVENAPVIGVSAGAPSAMQLCLKHPDRCPALVLIVPLVYTPESADAKAPSFFFQKLLDVIIQSDFIYWAATKIARPTLVETILGTPLADYRSATAGERSGISVFGVAARACKRPAPQPAGPPAGVRKSLTSRSCVCVDVFLERPHSRGDLIRTRCTRKRDTSRSPPSSGGPPCTRDTCR